MDHIHPTIKNHISRRYDRIAGIYDILEWPVERFRFGPWRSDLFSKIQGPRVLEVGVGTGKNLPYYRPGAVYTAIDFSKRMLAQAIKAARWSRTRVDFCRMDIQHPGFGDQRFDTILATFVFCSVPDPVKGLRELKALCKPDGQLLLIEHMRPEHPLMGRLFDLLNPVAVQAVGANINRRTMDNIHEAGWVIDEEKWLSGDVVRFIRAHP